MSVVTYSGYLNYREDEDEIKVHELILRDGELSFDLTTTWDDEGKWRRSGSAIKSPGDEVFRSEARPSKCENRNETGDSCSLIFKIKSANSKNCEIVGAWEEGGYKYQFKGQLQRKRRERR